MDVCIGSVSVLFIKSLEYSDPLFQPVFHNAYRTNVMHQQAVA